MDIHWRTEKGASPVSFFSLVKIRPVDFSALTVALSTG